MPDPRRRRPCPASPVRSRRRAGQQRAGDQARRARWDAGTTITERDATALRWLGEQYGARSDVLRVLLGRLSPSGTRAAGILGDETLRQIVARWSTRNLVNRHRLLGWQWAVPTAKALHLVGLDVPAWTPVLTQLAHVHAVGIVRLAVESTLPKGGRWVSERELRHDAGRHVPDGAVELSEEVTPPPAQPGVYGEDVERLAARVAIEVELTRKSAARLHDLLRRPRHGRYLRTIYFAPDEVAAYLHAQVARVQPRHPIEVRRLPYVEGTTYGGAQ